MIKTATKQEVVQVAHNLLDPLMENVHRDVENLRAQLVALEKETQRLRAEYKQSAKRLSDQIKRHEYTLKQVLARFAEMENRS